MLKLSGSIFIILSFTFYGISASLKQKKRCESLKNLMRCAKYITLEVSYRKTRCELILKEAAMLFHLPFLEDVKNSMKESGIYSSFKTALERHSQSMALNDEDIKAACSLSSLFSYSEDEQTNAANSVLKLLELSFNNAKTTYDTKSKLIRSGSLLCGILIAVLLF